MLGYSLTSAPLVVKDKVIVGVTGGEFGARGFLDAYDAATGKRLWRWYAVPGPGEFGNDTWPGDSWKLGGSPMWLTGSYDPELNLVYWTVGNPGPQIDRSVRAGARQPVQRFGRRDRSRHRRSASGTTSSRRTTATTGIPARMSSSSTACGADRCASCCCTPIATGSSTCSIARTGKFLSGTPFVYQNWNDRLRRERPAHSGARIELEPGGQLLRLSDARRRHELPGAVLQPADRMDVPRVRGERPADTSARRCRTKPAGSTSAARRRRRQSARSRASPPPPPASRRSIRKPARRCGTSRSFRARLTNGVLATAGGVVFARDPRRQSRRARRQDRQVTCGTSRPAATWRPRP